MWKRRQVAHPSLEVKEQRKEFDGYLEELKEKKNGERRCGDDVAAKEV